MHPCDREGQTAVLKELLGEMGRDVVFTPPFWCDYGYNIKVGDSFYANHNLVITDGAEVRFGEHKGQVPPVKDVVKRSGGN